MADLTAFGTLTCGIPVLKRRSKPIVLGRVGLLPAVGSGAAHFSLVLTA